ncbi:MAG TPA: hypothetical protein VGK32_14925 [Vicinamibacterales bacterium]|jgi:hypothetical protein
MNANEWSDAAASQLEVGAVELTVVATSRRGTEAAVGAAREFGQRLGARLIIVVPRVVDFHEQLDEASPVGPVIDVQRFASVVPTGTVRVCVCRDERSMLGATLNPASLVFIGIRRLFGSKDRRLARWLAAHGHRVVLVDAVEVNPARGRLGRWIGAAFGD